MEHIKNIEIKNFKSIRHQKIEGCKRINVFVGPPNVGKSNILEALGLFSIDQLDSHIDELIRIDKNTTIFYDGDINRTLEITLNDTSRITGKYVKGIVSIVRDIDLKGDGFDNTSVSSIINDTRPLKQLSFELWESDKKIRNFTGALSDINNTVSHIYKYEFKKLIKYVSEQNWQLKSPNGENVFAVISANKKLKKQVADLFKSYDVELLFETSEQKYTLLKRTDLGIFAVPYSLIADTLQRVIFYKAAIQSNEYSILLLEEPEAHSFEPYIMEITNAIKNDENNNQYFIVTHSQYVIDELLRDKESRKDTNIYLVGLENSETVIKILDEETSKDVYEQGLNVFFNFSNLWEETEKV